VNDTPETCAELASRVPVQAMDAGEVQGQGV